MDYYFIESKHQKLLSKIRKEHSPRTKFLIITQYINSVFQIPDKSLQEAFLAEVLIEMNIVLKNYNPFGLHPDKTNESLTIIEQIISDENLSRYFKKSNVEIQRIKDEVKLLENFISGKGFFIDNHERFAFPLLESGDNEYFNLGVIDSLEITLNLKKGLEDNIFIIYPSAVETDELLTRQLEISWQFAKKYFVNKFGRKIPNFEIIIGFEKKYGIYTGNSLGIALTTALISALCNYFEIREKISFAPGTISSGEVLIDGSIPPLSKRIVESKINTAFFSTCTKFILPQKDEDFANECLNKLKKEFPNRELEIVGVKNIDDLLSRRNLIEIKSQNLIFWGANKLVKNKLALSLLTILIMVLGFIYLLTLDNNPNTIELLKDKLLVKNKFNKILWTKNYSYNQKIYEKYPNFFYNKFKILDIDFDGKNEVIITELKKVNAPDPNIYLFDFKGNEIWKYSHRDSVETLNEKFTGLFTVKGIIDTIRAKDRTELLLYIQHKNYYPSGILKLDLRTGKKISDILWHPGGIGTATLLDIDNDGKKEIIAGCISNGLNKAAIFSIEHDKLKGTFPTTKNYTFLNMELADFEHYIIIKQSDFGKHIFPKYNSIHEPPRLIDQELSVNIFEGKPLLSRINFGYTVRFDTAFKLKEIIIGDVSIMIRDSLVNAGKLQPPLTDTPEFHDSLLSNIEYWNGERFLKYFPKTKQQ